MAAPADGRNACAIDPITVEVIGSALESIVEEMGEALIRASYSTNIKERRDCSTALFDMKGTTLCQAEHIPIHLGSFLDLIPNIMRRNRLEDIKPGDVFIGNDAYEGGGTHLPDIVLAEPIFFEGRQIAWAVNLAHHADFLDRGNAHIFQEGLRIPVIRLYREGMLQKDIMELVLLNCQVPKERLSDFRAQMAANRLAVQRVQALCGKYGAETVLAAGDALQDYAERKMRAGIARIPDGTYRFEDEFDSGETAAPIPLACEIEIRGDEMRLSFDAPPQGRASYNMTMTALKATVFYAVKSVVDPTILPNAGLARPLTIEAPKGSILNCELPAAVYDRLGPGQRVVDLIHGALARAVPAQVQAACNGACTSVQFIGAGDDGRFWGYVESIGGGAGARPNKDGLDGVHIHLTNTSNLPVEALEIEYPLTLMRYELVDGSGGVGTYRGGMGLRRVYRADADCRLNYNISRIDSSPWGLMGGGEGGRSWAVIKGRDVERIRAFLPAGSTTEIVTGGSGGYGPPEKRPLAEVLRDIREGAITRERALQAYAQLRAASAREAGR